MGAWGVGPRDNDAAADWLSDTGEGKDIDSKIESALQYQYDNYDEVRAAACLLDELGSVHAWPGDPEKYDAHVKRALEILEAMVDENSDDEDMDFLELWDNDPEVIRPVEQQIEN